MIKLSNFFLLYVTILSFTWITEVKSSQNALVFDPVNLKLQEPEQPETCTSTCIFACPYSNKMQQLISTYGSISGIGIFSRFAQIGANLSSSVVCATGCKPVMIQDEVTKTYETGFEFFYEDGQADLKYEKYDQLIRLATGPPKEDQSQDPDGYLVSKIKKNGNTVFHVPYDDSVGDSNWTYFWISVLSIQVSDNHRQISFTKDQIHINHKLHQTMFMCEYYSLEDHRLEHRMPSLRWMNYREKFVPQHTDEKENNEDADHEAKKYDPNHEKNEYDSNDENNHTIPASQPHFAIDEIQIMPMRYFHTLSARLATCTYLNLAFVTNAVEKRLEEVDLYLYSMYRTWPSQIDIIFGVSGVSREARDNLLEKLHDVGSTRLRQFPIPMPQVIYRIVEYKTGEEMRNAIVVIHNLVASVRKEERICTKESELQGWHDLGQGKVYPRLVHPSGLTYACPVTSDTIQKIGANYEKNSVESFNLSEDQRNEIKETKRSIVLKTTHQHMDKR